MSDVESRSERRPTTGALRAVLALGGTAALLIVTACTQDVVGSGTPGALGGGGGGGSTVVPGSGLAGICSGVSGCPKTCAISESDIDTAIGGGGYRAGNPAPGSCSASEIAQLSSNINSGTSDPTLGLGSDCVSCLFSNQSDENWQVFVFPTDGSTAIVNFGLCYAQVDGFQCGKLVQYLELCLQVACVECASGSGGPTACTQAAQESGSTCGALAAQAASACPTGTITNCRTAIQLATKACGSGP